MADSEDRNLMFDGLKGTSEKCLSTLGAGRGGAGRAREHGQNGRLSRQQVGLFTFEWEGQLNVSRDLRFLVVCQKDSGLVYNMTDMNYDKP